MKKYILTLLAPLVEHPDELKVIEIAGSRTTIFELRCNKSDLGKVIGRSGKTVGSVRNLLSAMASRSSRKAVLEVAE